MSECIHVIVKIPDESSAIMVGGCAPDGQKPKNRKKYLRYYSKCILCGADFGTTKPENEGGA